jgi:hypothetical protein
VDGVQSRVANYPTLDGSRTHGTLSMPKTIIPPPSKQFSDSQCTRFLEKTEHILERQYIKISVDLQQFVASVATFYGLRLCIIFS